MKLIWTHRDYDAPADQLWELLTDPEVWPIWGPSVRDVEVANAPLKLGAIGTITTVLGAKLPFEITRYDEGSRWAWKVAGIPATDHTVEALGSRRSRVGFGVPWPMAPYLAICQLALQRIDGLVQKEVTT